jgi:3-oxoacyl-[acyl-carrier-protein] synthase II
VQRLPAHQVLVTVGTVCSASAIGSTETYRALVRRDIRFIGYAAFDAGLVDCVIDGNGELTGFCERGDSSKPVSLGAIEEAHGAALRAALGIRKLCVDASAAHIPSDIGAELPHDWESGGFRSFSGVRFDDVRQSAFRDMFGLFEDEPSLGPSLQSQLFLYAGMGALSALPKPLSQLLSEENFRIAAGSAMPGYDALAALGTSMQPNCQDRKATDRLAYRLASSLGTHGPALLAAMLAPPYNLSKVQRDPSLLSGLRGSDDVFAHVPQAPLSSSGACASALVNFCDIAAQMLLRYPGHRAPELVLWTAADAALRNRALVLEGFGAGALMSSSKLALLNEQRESTQARALGSCLAPFDIDANGTVVGHAGSATLVTTLEFAVRNKLDVTSIICGWGQSGETGGKGHFAGVGFGGENALIAALHMAHVAHGYGVNDFHYVAAHATGTRTNSRTDLATLKLARTLVAKAQGHAGPLRRLAIGAAKSLGDGHSMGETGLKSFSEALRFVLGEHAVAVPSLQTLDAELGEAAEAVEIRSAPWQGSEDSGALVATQGFGGFNGAMALRSATRESLARYDFESTTARDAYFAAWPEIRQTRKAQEGAHRTKRGQTLVSAEHHHWRRS